MTLKTEFLLEQGMWMPAKSIGSPNGAGEVLLYWGRILELEGRSLLWGKAGARDQGRVDDSRREAGWEREGAGGQVLRLGAGSCRGQKAAELLNEACTVRERCLQLGRGVMGSRRREPSSPQNNSPLLRETLGRIKVGIIQKPSRDCQEHCKPRTIS